jgi:hypothetical protein
VSTAAIRQLASHGGIYTDSHLWLAVNVAGVVHHLPEGPIMANTRPGVILLAVAVCLLVCVPVRIHSCAVGRPVSMHICHQYLAMVWPPYAAYI